MIHQNYLPNSSKLFAKFIKIICQIHQNYLPNSSNNTHFSWKSMGTQTLEHGGTWGLLKPPWSFHIFFKNCKIRLIVQIIRLIEKTISMNRQCPNWKCSTTTTNTNKVFVVVIVAVMCVARCTDTTRYVHRDLISDLYGYVVTVHFI
jgi:hypothetical protein